MKVLTPRCINRGNWILEGYEANVSITNAAKEESSKFRGKFTYH